MVERSIKGVKCHAIHQDAKSNEKYMKDYNEDKESSYLQYWNVNNLHGLVMSQTLPADGFLLGWKYTSIK